ncbi:MAG TPA: LPS assembly protein LptD [Nitrospirota bacterium]|nr:LPS assembly protein LptD [Nitrospirota bacterium]
MGNLWKAIILVLVVSAGLPAGAPRCAYSETPPKKIPVNVTADKLDYDRDTDVYIAAGHVKIEQAGIRLEADKVILNNKTGVAEAEGNVYLQDQGNVVRAAKLTTNLRTSEGVIYKGDVFMKKDNYHLKGDVIERKSETVYHVEQGEFTTCDEDDWFIKAKELNIDLAGYATGDNVYFKVAGLPMFYTPYFLFPVRRQSGFLLPEPSYSRSQGVTLYNSFFWAISDSQDATISSDYRARIGHGTSIDYRYNNSQESRGEAYAKFWDIYHTEVSRWEFRLKHMEEFAEDLSARVDINQVSDYNYYHDLEYDLEVRARPYVDSNAFYVERWNTASLYLLGQDSTDLTRTNENTIQKLPELRYTIYEENLAGPLHLNFDGSATNFYEQAGRDTRRMDFNPELTAVFASSGLSLTPRVGARATFYDRNTMSDEPVERKYAYVGADLNARVSKVFGVDGDTGIGRIRHSIEPTISYIYIPNVDQQNIPQFDSVDSPVTQSTVTFSLINRLTAHYKESKESQQFSTFDLLVFKLSEAYDLKAGRDQNTSGHALSVINGQLYVRTPKAFTMTASADYDAYTHIVTDRLVGTSYTGDVVSLNLAENYVQNPASHYLIGGGTLKHGKWTFSGEWWRDIYNKMTTEQDYSVNYASQCWGVKVLVSEKPGDDRYTILFDLRGIGSKGKAN